MLVISNESYKTFINNSTIQSCCKYYDSNEYSFIILFYSKRIYICYCDKDYPSIIFNGDMKYIVHSENYLAPVNFFSF